MIDSRALELQQAILLERLRKAGGAAVSYAELQDAGIEFPASVVSELELAGVPVRRSRVNVSGARPLLGVRLDASRDPSSTPAPLRIEGRSSPAQPPRSDPAPGVIDSRALELQQAILLERLRKAGGAAVSYAELQDAGIEFPASVVSELELAGVPVRRSRVNVSGARRLLGVRLDASRDPSSTPAPLRIEARSSPAQPPRSDPAPGAPLTGARAAIAGGGAIRRWVAPAALATAVSALAVLALVALAAHGGRAHHAVAQPHPLTPALSAGIGNARQASPSAGSNARRASSARPLRRPPPTPVSAALATELDARGHNLLAEGRYGDAISVLRMTLAVTGERLVDCLQPVSETCLTYAYALYDLGRALELSGHPTAAAPVLQRRLQIDNQRPIVQAELTLALTSGCSRKYG